MPQKTKTGADGPREVPNFIWAMFAVLVVFVYFFGLTIPFVGPDEPRYAQVAREMLSRGETPPHEFTRQEVAEILIDAYRKESATDGR